MSEAVLSELAQQRYRVSAPAAASSSNLQLWSAKPAVKPRLLQSVVLSTDRYQPVSRDAVADYDRTMIDFYTEQLMDVPAGGCSVHSAERVKNAAALNGRDRLVEALRARGFGLR